MESLEWHVSRSGASMVPDDFDIKKFHAALFELMGSGADIIMDLVAKKMADELKLADDLDGNLTSIERVLKILEIAEKVKR